MNLLIFILLTQYPSQVASTRPVVARDTRRTYETFISPSKPCISKRPTKKFALIEDKRLLSLDVMSILLSNQLRGFSDVIEDPSFWDDGGFTQPIFSIPAHSTLASFVQRDCILTSIWLAVAIAYGDYAHEKISYKSFGFMIFTFCILRLLTDIITLTNLDFMSTCKDLWYAIVIVLAFRLFYYRRFY